MNKRDWEILLKWGVTPDNLSVGGSLYLRGTGIVPLYVSNHGYRLDRTGVRYIAGFRNFSAGDALSHWGSEKYPDQQRGKEFCKAVRAEEARRVAK